MLGSARVLSHLRGEAIERAQLTHVSEHLWKRSEFRALPNEQRSGEVLCEPQF